MKFHLVHTCGRKTAALTEVTLTSCKGSTAMFTGRCGVCGEVHTVMRRATPGTMRSSLVADPRTRYRVMRNGAATPYFIAVPYSMNVHQLITRAPVCTYMLGRYELTFHHKTRTITGFMPDSWFVDLSVDVPCAQEMEAA
jgi:hypothetical protein